MPRSVAVPVMICSTTIGEGFLPWWVLRYAWITNAASPAVSGADSLVPPVHSMDEGSPAALVQSAKARGLVWLGVQSAQPESPGATTSAVRGPSSVKTAELMEAMLLSRYP